MGKRRKILGMLVSTIGMATIWQLSDSGVIPTENFWQKLVAVALGTGGIFIVTRFLLGREGEPI